MDFTASTQNFPFRSLSHDEGITLQASQLASFGGHGTLEILRVTRCLEDNGFTCCLVGTSALIYYGADRHRGDWHICVPSDRLEQASTLLKSDRFADDYIPAEPSHPQPWSLVHTFPRFQCRGLSLFFKLIPSEDCHMDCIPANIERSRNRLPYPKLDVYIQSLIDMHDMVALCDVVDGSNVSEEWGITHLMLDGTNDLGWVERKNRVIRAQNSSSSWIAEVGTTAHQRKQTWEEVVRGKEARLGFKHPKHLFATRFRLHSSQDPWLKDRLAA